MRIHYLQHVPFEGLGSIESWIKCRNHKLTRSQLFNGQTPPQITDFDWLIIMGGPMNVYDIKRYPWLSIEKHFIEKSLQQNKTILGICLGAQLLADVLGAEIHTNPMKEIGWFPITKSTTISNSSFSSVLPDRAEVFHWHGDTFSLPDGSILLASSNACKNQAFLYGDRILGLQFHLETTVASAKNLIHNCADEIIKAPYVQSAEEMLADTGRFHAINHIMDDVLTYLQSISNG